MEKLDGRNIEAAQHSRNVTWLLHVSDTHPLPLLLPKDRNIEPREENGVVFLSTLGRDKICRKCVLEWSVFLKQTDEKMNLCCISSMRKIVFITKHSFPIEMPLLGLMYWGLVGGERIYFPCPLSRYYKAGKTSQDGELQLVQTTCRWQCRHGWERTNNCRAESLASPTSLSLPSSVACFRSLVAPRYL